MNENKLPKHFLDENPLRELSTAQLTYFQMNIELMSKLNEQVSGMVEDAMDQSRRGIYEIEKEGILKCDTAEEIVQYMRKMKEPQNRFLLIAKALESQEEIMPLILKRLLTSAHDVFIENAAILLANSDMKDVEQLYDIFKDIRSPYARSETSIVFGVKQRKDYTSLLLEQYELIRRECPGKNYEQGPLLALHLIHGK